MKVVAGAKEKLEGRLFCDRNNARDIQNEMSATIKKLETSLNLEIEDKSAATKKVGMLIEEREKMKQRITKLKARRGKVD